MSNDVLPRLSFRKGERERERGSEERSRALRERRRRKKEARSARESSIGFLFPASCFFIVIATLSSSSY